MHCSSTCPSSPAARGRFGLVLLLALPLASSVAAVELAPELRLPPLDLVGPDIRARPQEPRNVTPRSRPRPELAPLGARIRAFVLSTRVDLRAGYNDNLFATNDDEVSDVYARVAPTVDLRSDWSRHAIRVGAHASSDRYRDTSRENNDNWGVMAEGRADLGRASSLFGHASEARLHEDRASPDSLADDEPTAYRLSEAMIGAVHPFGRFEARVQGRVSDYRFESTRAAGVAPGTLVGSARDRRSTHTEARLRYSIWPGYGAFVRGAFSTQNYDNLTAAGVNRDSKGYEASVGVDLELTDLIFGNAYIGRYQQRYDEPGVDPEGGPTFGADLYWNVTRLSTLHLQVARSVQESTQPGASGYLSTNTGLELEHELLRNLLLVAGSQQTRRDYDGVDRQETLWQHSFGANFLANRHVQLRLQVGYRDQDASGGGRRFTQTFVEQAIVLQH